MTAVAAPPAPASPVPANPPLPEMLPPTPIGNGKPKSQKDGRTFQVVSFRLGEEEYGVDIMTVQEIILVGCITQVPEVPPHVLGVINLRGNVIPILNLRRRFGMADQAASEATRIVVMNLAGRTVGVVVDGVSEVLRLSHDDIAPTPPSLSGAGRDYVTGLARRKERLLVLLDMARLLVGTELTTITETAKNGAN